MGANEVVIIQKPNNRFTINVNEFIIFQQRLEYLSVVGAVSIRVLMHLFRNYTYFNRQDITLNDVNRKKILSKLGFNTHSFSMHVGKLCNTGLLVRICNNSYLYNPHIFCYADSKTLQEWQSKFKCSFNDDDLTINIERVEYMNRIYPRATEIQERKINTQSKVMEVR